MATSVFDDELKLRNAVKCSTSYTQVIKKFFPNHHRGAGHYKTVQRRISKFRIDTSHFDPNGGRIRALHANTSRQTIPLDEILNGKHPHYRTTHLKERLLKENILSELCARCGVGAEWNGSPLTLQLDHIDGDSSNHRLSNLQILCPNCHSQTTTFCKGSR